MLQPWPDWLLRRAKHPQVKSIDHPRFQPWHLLPARMRMPRPLQHKNFRVWRNTYKNKVISRPPKQALDPLLSAMVVVVSRHNMTERKKKKSNLMRKLISRDC